MTTDRDDHPLALDRPDEALRLREALNRAGYEPQRIRELLNVTPLQASSFQRVGKSKAILLRRTAGGAPLDTLVRLFLLGVTADLEAARRALAPSSPEPWLEAGLLRPRDGGVAAALQLSAFEHLVLAIDPLWSTDISPYHVLSVGSSSRNLAQMTVRRPSRRTLDVGAGCGIQAFLAAPHSAEVIGVDRNARAVNVAAFNAQLNGLANTTFVTGDLYAPVRDRRFDLVVANPPYVISPESRFLYRDSGLKGDEIAQRVIREGAGLLSEGGFLQVICEWAHPAGQDWRARLAGWFRGSGCDAWVTRFTTVDPLTQAETWLEPDPSDAPDAMPGRLQAWLDYYRQEGIEAVSDGVISLRKRAAAGHWLRIDDAPQPVGPCGPSVERGFAAADFLAAHDDEALLGARLRLAPEVVWEQRLTPTAEGWQADRHQLYLRTGLAYRGDVDPRCVALVERCRGGETVRQALEALNEPGRPPLDPGAALALVRGLVEQGFLLPA
jgi:protein-L-isoaspartate O-methyltransferase